MLNLLKFLNFQKVLYFFFSQKYFAFSIEKV